MTSQKALHDCQAFRIVECRPAMRCAVDYFELNRRLHLLASGVQFLRLIDWHLRVLISVKQKQGRIVTIDMEDRAGEASERENVGGLAAEQEFERWNANLQTVGSGLAEDRREVRCAVEADDALHVRTLRAVAADVSFEFRVSIGNTNERGEMSASRVARNYDLLR